MQLTTKHYTYTHANMPDNLQKMVLSMMYASDSPTFTGWWSSWMFLITTGTCWYTKIMSPLLCSVAWNVKSPELGLSCNTTFSHCTVNAVPVNISTVRKKSFKFKWRISQLQTSADANDHVYPSTYIKPTIYPANPMQHSGYYVLPILILKALCSSNKAHLELYMMLTIKASISP